MATVLLTGAAGYLGACVLAQARERGLEVQPLAGRLEAIAPGSLTADAVIHCAAARRNRPEAVDACNREGTRALLAGLAGRPRFIYVSSRSVYAPSEAPLVDEASALGTEDPYGASKLAGEALVEASGLPFVTFRSTALFGQGRGQTGDAFPGVALRAFLHGRPVCLHHPDRLTDYLDVETFAALLLDALGPGAHWGQAINAAGPPRSLHGMIRTLGRVVEAERSVRPILEGRVSPPPLYPMLATRRLEALFGPLGQPDDETLFRTMVRHAPV